MQIKAILSKKAILGCLLLTLSAHPDKTDIVGRWKTKPSEKGNVTLVNFKSDNHFDGFINKKPFVTGTYQYQYPELYFIDNGCEGKTGRYKVIFFSNDDSIRLEPIADSCKERMEGMKRMVLGRITK